MYITLSFTNDISFKNSVVFDFFSVHFDYLCIHFSDNKLWEKKVIIATVTFDKLISPCNGCSVSKLHLGFNLQFTD